MDMINIKLELGKDLLNFTTSKLVILLHPLAQSTDLNARTIVEQRRSSVWCSHIYFCSVTVHLAVEQKSGVIELATKNFK